MSILDKILIAKRAELANAKPPAASRPAPARSLYGALKRPAGQPVRVLAEVKRASPSAGPIRPNADPVAIAREYAEAGAAAISVLTDREFFDGSLEFLRPCRAAVNVPILRKDFLIDPRQIDESGDADAILLIVAALTPTELETMLREADAKGLEALVEVHSMAELDTAMSQPAAPKLLGVNHRDLKTFAIDMTLTEQIAKRVPDDVVLVAESGIKTAADVRRLGDAGAHAVLVGETLMRAPSPGAALRELLA